MKTSTNSWCGSAGLALGLLLWTLPAHAGLRDAPQPRFPDGSASVTVFETSGVLKRGRLQTLFLCSSAAAAPTHIAVELFDPTGARLNDIAAGVGVVEDVAPGATVTIGTSTTASFLESAIIPLTVLSQGSARVVAGSPDVVCNVVLIDDLVTPPATLATLPPARRPQADDGSLGRALPRFADGKLATHALLLPGAVKRGRVETVFFCTSIANRNIDVGVEVFAQDGTRRNDVAAGNGAILDVAPGQTVTIGTTGTGAFLESTVIVMDGVAQGLARIVSTSPELLCTALLLDSDGAPPVSMTGLGD